MDAKTDYSTRRQLVNSALSHVNLGGIEKKFETKFPDDNEDFGDDWGDDGDFESVGLVPEHVAFYDGDRKVGELYFTEDPMRLEVLDPSFKPYENALRTYLKF